MSEDGPNIYLLLTSPFSHGKINSYQPQITSLPTWKMFQYLIAFINLCNATTFQQFLCEKSLQNPALTSQHLVISGLCRLGTNKYSQPNDTFPSESEEYTEILLKNVTP